MCCFIINKNESMKKKTWHCYFDQIENNIQCWTKKVDNNNREVVNINFNLILLM